MKPAAAQPPMSRFPIDLGAAVRARLLADGEEIHGLTSLDRLTGLDRLLDAAFHSSFQTDELRPTRYTIALVDMTIPDPRPPMRPVAYDWRVVRFDAPVPASASLLAKLGQTGSSGAAMLAVDLTFGDPKIWGLVDQSIHYSTYLRHGREPGPRTPGVLQVTVDGPGAISVLRNCGLVAALHGGVLVERRSKPMHAAALAAALEPSIAAHVPRIEKVLNLDVPTESLDVLRELDNSRWSDWRNAVANDWIRTLARVLLRIVSFRHGGTLVLTPGDPLPDVRVRYPISYARLGTAFEKLWRKRLQHYVLTERTATRLVTVGEVVSYEEYYGERRTRREEEDAQDEVNGCIEFIAALSRIDGAILLGPDLRVVGFGAEFLSESHARKVEIARDDDATLRQPFDTQGLGTRHGSLIRFCSAHPDALGFLVSQDGTVRLMKVLQDDLVVWPEVDLLLDAQPAPETGDPQMQSAR
jgi:hypothetical protein